MPVYGVTSSAATGSKFVQLVADNPTDALRRARLQAGDFFGPTSTVRRVFGQPEPPDYERALAGTVVVLGSSNAAGMGASTYVSDPSEATGWRSPSTSWAGRLETALQSQDPNWVVINRSISGSGTTTSLSRFMTDVAPARPSHVILCTHPLNDNFDAQLVLRNMLQLVNMCRLIGAIPIVRGAYAYNSYTLAQYRAMLDLNQQLEQLGVHVFDHWSTIDNGTGGFVRGSTFHVDGLHPNDAGYQVLFDAIDLNIFRRYALPPTSPRFPGAWKIPDATPDVGTGILLNTAHGLQTEGLRSFTMRSRIKAWTTGGPTARAFFSANLLGGLSGVPLRLRNSGGLYDVAMNGQLQISTVDPRTGGAVNEVVLIYNQATNLVRLLIDNVEIGVPTAPDGTAVATTQFSFAGRYDSVPAIGYGFSDTSLWNVALGSTLLTRMSRTNERPKGGLIFDADFRANPNGYALPNLVNNGVLPILNGQTFQTMPSY